MGVDPPAFRRADFPGFVGIAFGRRPFETFVFGFGPPTEVISQVTTCT